MDIVGCYEHIVEEKKNADHIVYTFKELKDLFDSGKVKKYDTIFYDEISEV